jgi:hypothetical protein
MVPLTVADAVDRHAESRPGMTLVDYAEVGLPVWRITARCDVLAPKAISTIDETTMSAIALGINDPLELQVLLGLDEQVLGATLTGLVTNEWACDAGEGTLAITEAGREILSAAMQIVSREIVVPFDYDGLLRRPIFDQTLLDRRRGASRGLREVPPDPERPPDVFELRGCRQDIARVLRNAGRRRDRESQLLEVRSIDRRDRHVLPALALIFAPQGRGRCEVALAIGDELSIDHEAAFVNAGLANRIGLDRSLRATQRRPVSPPGPVSRHAALDPQAEQAARRALREARESPLADESQDGGSETDQLRRARGVLNSLPARTVLPHEHDALLRVALGSRQRLLLVGGAVTAEHVDGRFLRRLRQILDAGTLVRIVVAGAAPDDEQGLAALRTTAGDYPGLIVDEQDVGYEGALLSDNRFVAFGAFPWLGQLGDRDRPLADRRSLLIRDTSAIDDVWNRVDGRTPAEASPQSASRTRRPRRRRRPRHQQHND